ncbi:MAG TPA: heparinase II/III family protein, partial [Armatimonadota bacterium]|nr:heparinase II/III family protein [Armatimonadota bacterium]
GYDWPTYAGGNDGGLSMGPYYGLDGTALKWEAFDAMKKLGYADLYSIPFVQNLGDFYLYMMPPNARFFGTFGDGGATVHINSCAMLERWDMLWLSQVYQNPGWRWWVANKKIEASDPPADPLDPSGVQWNYQILLLGLREAKTPVAASPPTVPNSKLFPESGFVSMHTDIANPAEDTILNMRCAPYPRGSVHHSQPDQNAFVLYHHGAPLAINAAYYGGLADVDFGDPYSVYWGRQTKSKNAILIDNVGQRPDRATSAGEILQFDSTADYDYFVGDAVQAYNLNQSGIANAVRRHAAMVHKPGEAPYVVMVDEVRMPAAHNIQWLLHTMSQAVVDAANQKIILTYGNVHAQVRLFAPQALTISQTNLTDPLLTVDTARLGEHWHLTCATPSAATTFLIGSVFFPYVDGEEGAIPSISGHANGDNSQFTFTVGADTVNVDVASMAMSIVSGQTP